MQVGPRPADFIRANGEVTPMRPKQPPTPLVPPKSSLTKKTLTADAVATLARGSDIGTPPCLFTETGREWREDRSNESIAGSHERFRPYRHLAVRVLARAVLDVMDPAGSSSDRESAREFLAGSVMLRHWCRVAALDPDRISQYVERCTAGFARVPQDGPGTTGLRKWEVH
jgi:hypothetical protein